MKMMFMLSMFFYMISPLSTEKVSSLEYGLFANNQNVSPIKHLFVISERCSGSNYINSLILQNFPLQEKHLGHKHFPPWYELPIDEFLGNPKYYTFEDTDHFLFVVIFRNAYDWARSFHLKPWHAAEFLKKLSFSQFIRSPWITEFTGRDISNQFKLHPLMDLNPCDRLPFENIFALRTAKIKAMLEVKERASNVYYINYEVVRDHPQEVLKEMSTLFLLDLNSDYSPVEYVKGTPHLGKYKPKAYIPLSNENLVYINSKLDPDIEGQIGYRLIADPLSFDFIYD